MTQRKPAEAVDKVTTKRGLDPVAVAEKLREHHGNQAATGRAFGVSRQAVSKLVLATPALQEVARECRESMIDNAESVLYRAVLAGEAWAVCFFLKCQAKSRGYVEKAPETYSAELAAAVFEQVAKRHRETEAKPDGGA